MPIRQFADTSSVSIAYAIDNAADSSELTETDFTYVPFTSEGFQITKESQQSTAITANRRPSGSKNTQGSASGSVSAEFGYVDFILDMLKLSLMGEWQEEMDDSDSATGAMYAIDGETLNFFVTEKRIKGTKAGTKHNYLERYYGNLVNEATINIGGADLITMDLSTMSAYADVDDADASADYDAGGLATTYTKPASYEIADASNNISNIVIKDESGTPLEVVWSDATLTITNNVREQHAVGNEFAAGMAMGKVAASLSGTIYYYDDTVLKAHLDNKSVSAEIVLETKDGTFKFLMPSLKAEAPSANAQGENQDYTQSLTLNAERGDLEISNGTQECVIAIVHEAAV